MSVRNFLFDKQICFKEKMFDLPVISIGNITVGGTGKTPHTEYLISFLGDNFKLAILSRGYGRKTKGYRAVSVDDKAVDSGDEPLQIKQKFPELSVNVCEKRVDGIEAVLNKSKSLDCILLDDAFQHRHVKPSLSVLLVDYNRPIWADYPFPVGMLRESRAGAKRADLIVVSKCPEKVNREDVVRKLKPKKYQQVFFTKVKYGSYCSFLGENASLGKEKKVVAVTGIAQSRPFVEYLKSTFSEVEHLDFGDHHNFSCSEIADIQRKLDDDSEDTVLITSEKDFIRLKTLIDPQYFAKSFYLPITIEFLFEGKERFCQIITDHITSFGKK